MSAEEELKTWLNRSDKSPLETFQFVIKAWKSAEFVLPTKYEILLNWLVTNLKPILLEDIQQNNLKTISNLLELKWPIGLISIESRVDFISGFLKFAKKSTSNLETRNIINLLFLLAEHEAFQSIYKHHYNEYCSLFGYIFVHYDKYLQHNSKQLTNQMEREFFDKVITSLIEFIKRLPEDNIRIFGQNFWKNTLPKMVEVSITLKDNNLIYFNEILEVEKLLFLDYTTSILKDHRSLDIHVNLINFECALINCRNNLPFYQRFIKVVFKELQSNEEFSNPNLYLTIYIYVINLFKKYEIQLNFQFEKKPLLEFLSNKIENVVNNHTANNFYEVLSLLCSTIKLNPLILEHNIFKIAIKMMTTPKHDKKDFEKYEEFLTLLMYMFKKLNRPEKLVSNLLNALKTYLKDNKITKKIKRKLKLDSESPSKKSKTENLDESMDTLVENQFEETNIYLKILLKEFTNTASNEILTTNTLKCYSFSNITFAWPSATVGKEFSKFISTLVSKPSLVVWKTLIFAMAESIEKLKTIKFTELDETILFEIDFNSALLSQYLSGSRLAEHANIFFDEISTNRDSTVNILKEFGKALLNLEHNNRIMNAFLEVSYHFCMFDLIFWYYCSDLESFSNVPKSFHDYLTTDEWILIEQRIINFGKFESKLNMNRICMQKLKAKMLFQYQIASPKFDMKKILLSSTFSDLEQIIKILLNSENFWLSSNLEITQKQELCELILPEILDKNYTINDVENLLQNNDFFEILLINIYKILSDCFTTKKSILSNLDFTELQIQPFNMKISNILEKIQEKSETYSIKKFDHERLEKILKFLSETPIGYCHAETKIEIFALNLALYRDLKATQDNNLSTIAFGIFEDILNFKPQIKIFEYFTIDFLLKIFPPKSSEKFYNFLFQTLNKNDKSSEKCLETINEILKNDDKNLSEDNLKLIMIVIETLSHQTNYKHYKKYQEKLLEIYGEFIKNYFYNEDERNEENDKEFVEKTISVFSIYLNFIMLKDTRKELEIDEEFRKCCKIYIGYSINCHNASAVRLINVSLNYRNQLHFDPDEVQFVLQKYWDQLKINMESKISDDFESNSEDVMKLIINNKTTEEFRNILLELGKDANNKNIIYICNIIKQIAKCQLSLVKGAILNDHFKKIVINTTLNLEKDNEQQFKDYDIVLQLLSTMRTLCENRKIPLSPDHIDDILSFLMDINIKKYQITNDINEKKFKKLHKEMSELCETLIKCRHEIITDRTPQFANCFEELLQSICWYKCDRQKDLSLSEHDVNDLADLAQKLESIMHLLANHALEVKRVAPYLLTFVISLMVTEKRSTTLYSKIKTHVESICYDLISVCDHRVGSFILRCSNDATKHVYENLCKEFKKYRKFKGKV